MTEETASAGGAPGPSEAHFIEDLRPGMSAVYARTVTEADIVMFAQATGDDNPLHLDETYAARTRFHGRIAHGMLSAGYISAALGTRLPGQGCLYLSQALQFRQPVRIGDTVEARVTVVEVMREIRHARLTTVCSVGETVVVEGEALVAVPSKTKVEPPA